MRNDRGFLAKFSVAARMITMKMRVHDKFEWFVADSAERLFNFIRQRRELIIYNDDAVIPRTNTYVATRSLQHVDSTSNMGGLDLHFAEILLSLRSGN